MMALFSDKIISLPKNNEVEISIFGPGYGESIVLHIPKVGWGIIDSCAVKINKKLFVPPLEYLLKLLSPDFPKLAFVILTHPHEDHFIGLDKIILNYPGGVERVCRYNGQGIRELITYLCQQKIAEREVPLVKIFEAFRAAERTGAQLRLLNEMTHVFNFENIDIEGYGTTDIRMIALSPSGASAQQYAEMLFALYAHEGEIVQIINDRAHNLIAVALLLQIGNINVILCSDVESGSGDNTGWNAIVLNTDCADLWANLVKVAHHGSESGFNATAWQRHGDRGKPFAVITPFNRVKNNLPTKEDIERIKEVAIKVGITSISDRQIPLSTFYRKDVLRAIDKGSRSMRAIEPQSKIGMIRMRYQINGNLTESITEAPARWL